MPAIIPIPAYIDNSIRVPLDGVSVAVEYGVAALSTTIASRCSD